MQTVFRSLYGETMRQLRRSQPLPSSMVMNVENMLDSLSLNPDESAQNEKRQPAKQPEEEPVEEEVHEPFVPLTKEEGYEVECAFATSNRGKVLVTHSGADIKITGKLLQFLRPNMWLNDVVINVYLEFLKEREEREPLKFLKCYFFNTFFYNKLAGGNQKNNLNSVKRRTNKKKLGYTLNDCDKIFVPIHHWIHWCLAIINKMDKKFQYLDSLKGTDRKVLNNLAKYYVEEVKDKSGKDLDISDWEHEYVEDLPE